MTLRLAVLKLKRKANGSVCGVEPSTWLSGPLLPEVHCTSWPLPHTSHSGIFFRQAPGDSFSASLTGSPNSCVPDLSWFVLSFFFLIYLFIFGCVGSSFLREGSLQLRQVGATLHRSARASHHRGLSCCGAQAPDAQAQQLWLTGPVAPRHVGSSQTRVRTRVPCIGRQTLNHCATREALFFYFWWCTTYLRWASWKRLHET